MVAFLPLLYTIYYELDLVTYLGQLIFLDWNSPDLLGPSLAQHIFIFIFLHTHISTAQARLSMLLVHNQIYMHILQFLPHRIQND